MKKVSIFLSLAIIAIAGITLNSCQKSETDSVAPANDNSYRSNTSSQISSEVIQHAFAVYMQDQQEKGNLKSGAEFVPAFVTSDGFGVGDNIVYDENWNWVDGDLAFFYTELDENDFYRINPDGTYSIHISSTNANATYIDLSDWSEAYGSGCNMTMNYTGALVTISFEWDGVTYTFTFIDAGSEPNAVVWHGAGKVQFDGIGPKHNLMAHLTASQGWEHVKIDVKLN